MKKYILVCLALMLVVGSGCKNRLFKEVLLLNRDMAFDVDRTGAFTGYGTITAASVNDALNFDDEDQIQDVFIETVKIRFTVVSGNVASSVKINCSAHSGTTLFTDFTFDLTDPSVIAGEWQEIGSLNESGVSTLTTDLTNLIEGVASNDINFTFNGNSVPGGQKIKVNLELRVTGTVLYWTCFEVPPFIGVRDCNL